MTISIEDIKLFTDKIKESIPSASDDRTQFKRTQPTINAAADSRTQSKKNTLYSDETLHTVLTKIINDYNACLSAGIDINYDVLQADRANAGWMAKLLPLLASGAYSDLIKTIKSEYNYTDDSEVALLASTCLLMAHHSSPSAFTDDIATFDAMTNLWLEFILSLATAPEWLIIDPNASSYSTKHILKYINQFTVKSIAMFHELSKLINGITPENAATNPLKSLEKTYLLFLEPMKQVNAEHEKIDSAALLTVRDRLMHILANADEFKGNPESVSEMSPISSRQFEDQAPASSSEDQVCDVLDEKTKIFLQAAKEYTQQFKQPSRDQTETSDEVLSKPSEKMKSSQ